MTKLTLGQAIRNAIEVELQAGRFYRLLADSTNDAQARAFLEKMAGEEKNHSENIEAVGKLITGGEVPAKADNSIEGVETSPQWAFVDNITLGQSLAIALEAENHAALYYDAIASSIPAGQIADFFSALARTEEAHARRLEEMIKTIPA